MILTSELHDHLQGLRRRHATASRRCPPPGRRAPPISTIPLCRILMCRLPAFSGPQSPGFRGIGYATDVPRGVAHDFTAELDPKCLVGGGARRRGRPACLPPRRETSSHKDGRIVEITPAGAAADRRPARPVLDSAGRSWRCPAWSTSTAIRDRARLSRRARGPHGVPEQQMTGLIERPAGFSAPRWRRRGRGGGGRDVLCRDAARRHDHGLRRHRRRSTADG